MTKESTKNNLGKNLLSDLGKNFTVAILKGIALFPFGLIYALSNFLFFLNKYVLRYRYQVTFNNLVRAFPEKTEHEILEIRDKFYRHFFDFSLESVKLYSATKELMDQRIAFKGLADMEKLISEKKGGIILAFHYNNWEWCSIAQTQLKHPVLMVYNPPRNNKAMENFLMHLRGKWGGKAIRTAMAARTALEYRRRGETAITWLAADQTALAESPFWITFLNREAAFFKGPEVLAAKTNFPVFFQEIKKVGRGKYEAEFSLLIEKPGEMEPNEILIAYVEKMEEVIKNEPEYYLWSHKRWKHKRPTDIALIK